MRVSCFGDIFSHTHAAAESVLHCEGITDFTLTGYDGIFGALESVADGKSEMAVAPIENSYEGTVAETEDALGRLGLFIVGETVLPITQNLIALDGVDICDIRHVYSHPQALAQCRKTLFELLPNASCEAVAYTSAGLNRLDGHSAAVARMPKAGQRIIAANVEDSPDNCTRFIAVKASPRRTGDKVSVVFSAENKPGALLGVLGELNALGLNMTKIESRPAKKRLGQYVFYVDFLIGDGNISAVLAALSEKATDLRFLGRYSQYGTANFIK